MRSKTKGKLDNVREEDVVNLLNSLGKQKLVAQRLDVAETTLGSWLKSRGIKPITRWEKNVNETVL